MKLRQIFRPGLQLGLALGLMSFSVTATPVQAKTQSQEQAPPTASELHEAIMARKSLWQLKKLITEDTVKAAQGNSGQSAMHLAAKHYPSSYLMRLLAKAGADVNAQDAAGNSPLFYVSQMGHVSKARVLVDLGAKADLKNKKAESPIFIALTGGQTAMVQFFASKGFNLNSTNQHGQSGLVHAMLRGHDRTVYTASKYTINWQYKDPQQRGYVFHMANARNLNWLKFAVEHGAKGQIHQRDVKGDTPLCAAVSGSGQYKNKDSHPIIRYLLSQGANINQSCHMGLTPLQYAVKRQEPLTTKLLIDAGASVNQRNADGLRALQLAINMNDDVLKALLQRHGAKV